MAATVQIRRWTGASGSPTKTNITSANTVANAQDVHEATASSSSNPIKIPAAGTNYSYWVATRLFASVAPTGSITNIRWHTDGTNNFGTGVGCNVSSSASTYVQATGTVGTTGNILNNTNYSGVGTPSNAFTYKSTATLAVTGSISGTGDFGNFVVYQLTVTTTASPGPTSQETFTWLYDET